MVIRLFSRQGRLTPTAWAVLVLICCAFFLPGLVSLPPTDRDESSFAQATKQMIETGNYIDIRLQNEPRYQKPIGIYWLQSVAVRWLNPAHLTEIWAYRVPSFLGATVAVLATAALGVLLFSAEAGFLAAILLASCFLLNAEARLAKTDATLLACVTLAMLALASVFVRKKGTIGHFFLFWTALAVGILIKGPIILLPVAGVLGWFAVLRRMEKKENGKDGEGFRSYVLPFRNLKPFWGVLWLALLVSPWFIVIALQSHGAFFQHSAGHDLVAKIWQGQNRGFMPPGLYVAAFLANFFPFSLFTFFALPDVWKNRRDPAVAFCLGWIVPAWLVFELSSTKLPHYVLPIYPALALLTAHFFLKGFPALASVRRWFVALGVGVWMMVGMGLAVGFALLPFFIDDRWDAQAIGASVLLILSQSAGLFLFLRHRWAGVCVLALGSLFFVGMTCGATLPSLEKLWLSRAVMQRVTETSPCPAPQLMTLGYHEPSLVFLAGTQTLKASDAAEAAIALQQDGCRIVLVDSTHEKAFLDASAPLSPRLLGRVQGVTGHGGRQELTLYGAR